MSLFGQVRGRGGSSFFSSGGEVNSYCGWSLVAEKSHEEDTPTDRPPRTEGHGLGEGRQSYIGYLWPTFGLRRPFSAERTGAKGNDSSWDLVYSSAPHGCSCVLVLSLPGGHLESVGGGLAGELGVVGAPGECDAWMFFSSEKSCLITSKKLLKGLPTQMGRKETERANRWAWGQREERRRRWRDRRMSGARGKECHQEVTEVWKTARRAFSSEVKDNEALLLLPSPQKLQVFSFFPAD